MTVTDVTFTQTKQTTREPAEATSDTSAIETKILLSVFFFVAAWAGAVMTWGLPGLYLPAVALVPVIWVGLLTITQG